MRKSLPIPAFVLQFLLRYGVFWTALVFTVLSILVSLVVTKIIDAFFQIEVDNTGFIIAVIVPSIVAPLFTSIHMSTILELEQVRASARLLSITDELTQVYNRRYFIDNARKEIERTRKENCPLVLILFDADDFKKINDTYGHLCGDRMLQEISGMGRQMTRPGDFFARYGGEEFMLMMSDVDIRQASLMAERMRRAVEEIEVGCRDENRVRCTISLGVTELRKDDAELDDLLARADLALYEAKAAGKNCVWLA